MKNIFIGNLSFQTTESELRDAFAPFGDVTRARIITDRDSGRSRGFGFIEMANDDEAAKAITSLNQTDLGGRTLNVSEARPKPERTNSYGSGRREYARDYYRSSAR